MLDEYYQLLELPNGADETQIRTAYRKKAKLFHPDINKSADAHQQFLRLKEAHDILLSAKKEGIKKTEDFVGKPTQPSNKQRKQNVWNSKALKSYGIAYLISFFICVVLFELPVIGALIAAIFLALPITVFVAFFLMNLTE
jgi:curved DNA-binding protein CbpA